MNKLSKNLRIKIFKMKYKILFTFSILFKKQNLISCGERAIGKTRLIYKLARKFRLPVFTNWDNLYRECDTYSPFDSIRRLTELSNKVILVDVYEMQTELEALYFLQQRGNILIGFKNKVIL